MFYKLPPLVSRPFRPGVAQNKGYNKNVLKQNIIYVLFYFCAYARPKGPKGGMSRTVPSGPGAKRPPGSGNLCFVQLHFRPLLLLTFPLSCL